jgi:ATP-dependent DNA helicase RecQ
MNCTGKRDRQNPPAEMMQAAANFLRSDTLVLSPRERWPKSVLEEVARTIPQALDTFENGRPKTVIPEHLRSQEGRVLCVYGDAGWGQDVAHGKYNTGIFNDALLKASVNLIREKWQPKPAPEWVTAVPSQRHPELIQDFAKRLAADLGVPFFPVLRKRGETRQQKEMQNSSMQLRNLLKAFQVIDAPKEEEAVTVGATVQQISRRIATSLGAKPIVPPGPVLMVDDVVDSGWTLTLAGILLRLNGSGPAYPFALAKASLRGS